MYKVRVRKCLAGDSEESHVETGQGMLTVTRSRLSVGMCAETEVETVCVPTVTTGSLSAGPTLWELRFKAWH